MVFVKCVLVVLALVSIAVVPLVLSPWFRARVCWGNHAERSCSEERAPRSSQHLYCDTQFDLIAPTTSVHSSCHVLLDPVNWYLLTAAQVSIEQCVTTASPNCTNNV
jgi:hypothetical protein